MFFKIKLPAGTASDRGGTEAGLSAFASESDPVVAPAEAGSASPRSHRHGRARMAATLAIVILATASLTASAILQYRRLVPPDGSLVIETSAPGEEVTVAGAVVGRTPVRISLKPGTHTVLVGEGERRREMSVHVAPGASIVHHVEIAPPPASSVSLATAQHLRIESESTASAVLVDGIDRGPSPVTVADLTPGVHDVVVHARGATLRNRVTLQAGESKVLVFAAASKPVEAGGVAAAPASGGFLAVNSGVPVQIREGGRVIGSSDLDRQMLPTGEHTLEFVNEALGYQSRRTVRIEAGKTTSVQLERVNGAISINALPWAEVWIGGERIGQTPIGNLSRPIGTYDVVLRHPELGERRERVTITTKGPARLGVDLRRK